MINILPKKESKYMDNTEIVEKIKEQKDKSDNKDINPVKIEKFLVFDVENKKYAFYADQVKEIVIIDEIFYIHITSQGQVSQGQCASVLGIGIDHIGNIYIRIVFDIVFLEGKFVQASVHRQYGPKAVFQVPVG